MQGLLKKSVNYITHLPAKNNLFRICKYICTKDLQTGSAWQIFADNLSQSSRACTLGLMYSLCTSTSTDTVLVQSLKLKTDGILVAAIQVKKNPKKNPPKNLFRTGSTCRQGVHGIFLHSLYRRRACAALNRITGSCLVLKTAKRWHPSAYNCKLSQK